MRQFFMIAAIAGSISAMPVSAQSLTAADVGVSPLSGTSGTDYVKLSADAYNYELQAARLAAVKSKRDDIKGYAKQVITDDTDSAKALNAALTNGDRKITPPTTVLSDANKAKLELLRKSPRGTFDQLYLQQQLDALKSSWALQSGYVTDGTDASLKQVATTALPVVERHISGVKGLGGAN